MADGIAGGPATPAMRLQDNNSILGNFLHWVFVGNRPGAGLNAVPGQLFQMFNPTTKAGVANILGSVVGGGGGAAGEGEFVQPPRSSEEVFQQAAHDPATLKAIHDYLRSRVIFKVGGDQPGMSNNELFNMPGKLFGGRLQRAQDHNFRSSPPSQFPPEHLPTFHDTPHADGHVHEPDSSAPQAYHDYMNQKFAASDHHLDRFLAPRVAAARAAAERAAAAVEHHFFGGHPGFREYGLSKEHTGVYNEAHYAHDPQAHAAITEPVGSKAAQARNVALARLLHQHGLGPHARN